MLHITHAKPSSPSAHTRSTHSPCQRRTRDGNHGSSESNTTCSPARLTSGNPAKMVTTISSSVISSEPGTDWLIALRPLTSTSVRIMIANSASAASVPHSHSSARRSAASVCAGAAGPLIARSLLELADLGAEVGQHLLRVLQAAPFRGLDPVVLEGAGL